MDGHKNKAMPVEFRTGKQKVGGGGGVTNLIYRKIKRKVKNQLGPSLVWTKQGPSRGQVFYV